MTSRKGEATGVKHRGRCPHFLRKFRPQSRKTDHQGASLPSHGLTMQFENRAIPVDIPQKEFSERQVLTVLAILKTSWLPPADTDELRFAKQAAKLDALASDLKAVLDADPDKRKDFASAFKRRYRGVFEPCLINEQSELFFVALRKALETDQNTRKQRTSNPSQSQFHRRKEAGFAHANSSTGSARPAHRHSLQKNLAWFSERGLPLVWPTDTDRSSPSRFDQSATTEAYRRIAQDCAARSGMQECSTREPKNAPASIHVRAKSGADERPLTPGAAARARERTEYEYDFMASVLSELKRHLREMDIQVVRNNGAGLNCLLIALMQHAWGDYENQPDPSRYRDLVDEEGMLDPSSWRVEHAIQAINADSGADMDVTIVRPDAEGLPYIEPGPVTGNNKVVIINGGRHYEAAIYRPRDAAGSP